MVHWDNSLAATNLGPALERLKGARTALVLDQPFFGVLALRLMFTEDSGCQTMWTDGTTIGYNPDFVDTLSNPELQGVLAHEVLHCACGHPWRRGQREPLRWNVACDYAINYVLKESGLILPKGALQEKAFAKQYAEWIYDRVPPTLTIQISTAGISAGAPDVRDAPSAGEGHSGSIETEADWQQAVQQAAAAERTRGTLPGTLSRLIGLLAAPRVDWRSILRRFIQEASRADYRWTRPSTRYLSRGLYLPSLRSEALGPIAVAIDTSGSIDRVMLDQFASELTAIAEEAQPERVYVAYCDARIQRVDVFERGDPITLTPRGGGGTDFAPVMQWVDDLDDAPACLIYLTDLCGSHAAQPPGMPVLWATSTPEAHASYPVPYGEVVAIQA